MKWFKHKTASHEDPDISDAMDRFGDAGYTIFFIILEIYGREFGRLNEAGELTLSRRYFQRKLRRKWLTVERVLNFYQERARINWKCSENEVTIKIPQFIELASTWVSRTKSKPTQAPTEAPTEAPTAIEVEVEVDIKNKHICAFRRTRGVQRERFESVWKKHPRKRGNKDKAFAKFKKTVRSDEDHADILQAVENYSNEMGRLCTPEDKIMYASTWFNQWRSWISLEEVVGGDTRQQRDEAARDAEAKAQRDKAERERAAGEMVELRATLKEAGLLEKYDAAEDGMAKARVIGKLREGG